MAGPPLNNRGPWLEKRRRPFRQEPATEVLTRARVAEWPVADPILRGPGPDSGKRDGQVNCQDAPGESGRRRPFRQDPAAAPLSASVRMPSILSAS